MDFNGMTGRVQLLPDYAQAVIEFINSLNDPELRQAVDGFCINFSKSIPTKVHYLHISVSINSKNVACLCHTSVPCQLLYEDPKLFDKLQLFISTGNVSGI